MNSSMGKDGWMNSLREWDDYDESCEGR